MRPEYLDQLREELLRIREEDDTGAMRLTAASLREAHLLDSFIREVMRLKGDTISTMRYTTCDAPLGEYVIPEGEEGDPYSLAVLRCVDVEMTDVLDRCRVVCDAAVVHGAREPADVRR